MSTLVNKMRRNLFGRTSKCVFYGFRGRWSWIWHYYSLISSSFWDITCQNVKFGIFDMLYPKKQDPIWKKLLLFSKSAPLKTPITTLTFSAKKYVLTSVLLTGYRLILRPSLYSVQQYQCNTAATTVFHLRSNMTFIDC